MAVMMNPEPRVGIYIESTVFQGYIKVMLGGEKWIVDQKQTRIMREEQSVGQIN